MVEPLHPFAKAELVPEVALRTKIGLTTASLVPLKRLPLELVER